MSRSNSLGKRHLTAFAVVLLLLLVALVYWPAGGFGFVPLDDDIYVYRNPNVLGGLTPAGVAWSFTTLHAGFWIPLTWLSLMSDTSLWGFRAGGYHLTNVALHAAAVLLFFLLLRRLLGVTGIPLLAAALFAVHPLHVESVAWITERKDVLSQALFLLFLHAWLSHLRRPAPRRHTGALLVLALTLMAKPMAFTAPVLLLVLDGWPLGRLRHGGQRHILALVVEKVPAALLGLCFGVVTLVGNTRNGALVTIATYPPAHRAGNAIVTLAQNLGKTLWPADLSPYYPLPPGGVFPPFTIAAAAILLGTLAAGAFYLRRRAPWLAAGYAWYLAALAPVSGFLQSGSQVTADRFTYLPLLGVHTAVACLASRVAAVRRHPARGAALLLLPGLLAIAAHRQALFWRDGVTLFSRAVAVSQDSSLVRNNLGEALFEAGRLPEALPQFEAAIRLNPHGVHGYRFLGAVLGALGRTEEALAHLHWAIALDPGSAETRVALGDLLLHTGRLAEAEQEFQAALAVDPGSTAPLSGMAAVRLAQGRLAESSELAADAAGRDRFDARAWYLLGTATAQLGNPAEGERHLRRALSLEPDKADAGYNLALAILDQGRRTEARKLLDDLQRQHPGDTGIARLREQVANEAAGDQ